MLSQPPLGGCVLKQTRQRLAAHLVYPSRL